MATTAEQLIAPPAHYPRAVRRRARRSCPGAPPLPLPARGARRASSASGPRAFPAPSPRRGNTPRCAPLARARVRGCRRRLEIGARGPRALPGRRRGAPPGVRQRPVRGRTCRTTCLPNMASTIASLDRRARSAAIATRSTCVPEIDAERGLSALNGAFAADGCLIRLADGAALRAARAAAVRQRRPGPADPDQPAQPDRCSATARASIWSRRHVALGDGRQRSPTWSTGSWSAAAPAAPRPPAAAASSRGSLIGKTHYRVAADARLTQIAGDARRRRWCATRSRRVLDGRGIELQLNGAAT